MKLMIQETLDGTTILCRKTNSKIDTSITVNLPDNERGTP